MDPASTGFFLVSALGAVLYRFTANVTYRRGLLFIVNATFLIGLTKGVVPLWVLAGFATLGFGLLAWVGRARSAVATSASVVVLVGLFIYLKRYAVAASLPALTIVYSTIGLSYVLFRLLHLIIEAGDKDFDRPRNLIAYFNYLFFFPALISGPIQRYPDFASQTAAVGSTAPLPNDGFRNFDRLLDGVLKIMLVSAVLVAAHQRLTDSLFAPAPHVSWLKEGVLYGLSCAVFAINVYINFSGYMDIVIAVAAFMGVRLPENFDRPFKAANLLDLWSRWHITLSTWFRDYVFTPLMKRLTIWRPSPAWATFNGFVALFVSFTLMGVWHGTTLVFVFYGLAWGAAVSLTWFYQRSMRKRLGKAQYRELTAKPLYHYLGRGFTFAFFAVVLTCFWVDWHKFSALAVLVTPQGVLAILAAMTLVASMVIAALDVAEKLLMQSFGDRLTALPGSWAGAAVLCAKLIVLLHTAYLTGLTVPKFVYELY